MDTTTSPQLGLSYKLICYHEGEAQQSFAAATACSGVNYELDYWGSVGRCWCYHWLFAARYSQSKGQSGDLEEQVQQSQQRLTDYQREVAEHFATANAMVEQLADTQQRLQSYLNQSAELLRKAMYKSDLPFFAEDTIKQLRVANSLNKDHRSGRDSYSANDIPRDYTEGLQRALFK